MKKNDYILIGVIVLVIAILFAVVELTKEEGAYVVVKIDGTEVARYDLDENGEYELNGGTNILRIEDGVAYLIYANCPDHLCMPDGAHGGKIDQTGETITCLPNKLTVTVFGADGDVELVS